MILVVMGVTGCGKTTVGKLIAEQMDWSFYDADDFHSKENVEKMRSGYALNDQDRTPWLLTLNKLIIDCINSNKSAVLACSALKKEYRQILSLNTKNLFYVFLDGEASLITKRLNERVGHYMDPNLLASQFATLEAPSEDENAIRFEVSSEPEKIVEKIFLELGIA